MFRLSFRTMLACKTGWLLPVFMWQEVGKRRYWSIIWSVPWAEPTAVKPRPIWIMSIVHFFLFKIRHPPIVLAWAGYRYGIGVFDPWQVWAKIHGLHPADSLVYDNYCNFQFRYVVTIRTHLRLLGIVTHILNVPASIMRPHMLLYFTFGKVGIGQVYKDACFRFINPGSNYLTGSVASQGLPRDPLSPSRYFPNF